MKNIHVLPTDKQSRLYLTTKEYIFEKEYSLSTDECQNKHIYITFDEEIKIRDWVYCKDDNTVIQLGTNLSVMLANQQKEKYGFKTFYKIILTTDQYLIKDGVQVIDDEFLEWFVKNPSCEEVETVFNNRGITGAEKILKTFGDYKIIIPKEENFKHELRVLSKGEVLANRSSAYEFIDFDKQETLEEVAERLFPINTGDESLDYQNKVRKPNWISGAKWQQERMYSEEEARIIWRAGQEYCKTSGGSITFEQLTEKLKTKYPVKTKDKIISETLEETKQKARDYGNSLVEGTFENTNIIDDWLEKNGDPEIHKQVEQEAKELCEQNKISEEELERVISAPINLYSVIKYLFNKFKKIRYVR